MHPVLLFKRKKKKLTSCFRSKQARGYELWIDKITLNCIFC